jgi:plasmid stabilization system protein ParE
MNKYHINIAEEAINDIDHIRDHIIKNLHNPTAAKNAVKKIFGAIARLEKSPYLGRNKDADGWLVKLDISEDTRRLIVESYNIYYYVLENEKTLSVVKVKHQLQDQHNL